MKLARLDVDGKILEVFDKEEIEKRLHADVVSSLSEIEDSVSVGEYISNGVVIGAPPDDESKPQDGEWVKDPVIVAEKEKEAELASAKEVLKDLSSIRDEGLRSVLEAIVKCL